MNLEVVSESNQDERVTPPCRVCHLRLLTLVGHVIQLIYRY